jgi:hypothetical protein
MLYPPLHLSDTIREDCQVRQLAGERSMILTRLSPMRSQPAPILSAGSIALLFLVLGSSGLVGCGWEQLPAPTPRVKPVLAPLIIVATGDTGGRLTAANCGVSRPGGVANRAALLESLPTGSIPIILETGGAASGTAAADRVTWEYLLRAEQSLGTAAHNLGREEIALPPELLTRLANETQIPWVSSNTKTVSPGDSRERYLSEPLRVVVRGSAKVVILGVVSPRAANDKINVEDPVLAVKAVLADYGWEKKRPAALVVLADLDADEIETLRGSLPAQSLLINRGTLPAEALKATTSTVTCVPAAGEGAVVAELNLNRLASNGETVPWNITTPRLLPHAENPEFTPLLASYQRALMRGEFTAQDSHWALRRGMAPAPLKPTMAARTDALAYAGSQHCRACHATTSMHCDSAPHAAAWQALVDRGQQHEARCQRCHTTGFNSGDQPGLAQGFVSAQRTPQHRAVNCEACHGPSAAHTLEPMIPTPWVAKESCAQCHDTEHSPGFSTEPAWQRIQHPPQPSSTNASSKFDGLRF